LFLSSSYLGHAAEPASVREAKERAVSALEQDLKTDPNNSELWLHLGFAYRKLGKIDQAQNAFEKASTLNPHESDAYYMLALIYESKHQTEQAKKAWQDYLAAETDKTKRDVAEKHIHHLSQ
jgi:cytochrome c-type biogenesis protein CcmH/NrfG